MFSDNNAAVRLALGETQIVHETREFLESNGVKLDAFNRVNTSILYNKFWEIIFLYVTQIFFIGA